MQKCWNHNNSNYYNQKYNNAAVIVQDNNTELNSVMAHPKITTSLSANIRVKYFYWLTVHIRIILVKQRWTLICKFGQEIHQNRKYILMNSMWASTEVYSRWIQSTKTPDWSRSHFLRLQTVSLEPQKDSFHRVGYILPPFCVKSVECHILSSICCVAFW